MPRKPRKRAEQGYYHVVLKGSGNMILFEAEDDYWKFLEYLGEFTDRHDVGILAWCLMSNHVHLILFDSHGELSECVHDIASSYAVHFNRSNDHAGPVFDGRFHSVLIESDEQFLSAVRYVHDNPARASVCPSSEYPWSSYSEYNNPETATIDVETLFDLIGGAGNFDEFSDDPSLSDYVFRSSTRLNDDEALRVAKATLGANELGLLKSLPISQRTHGLQMLRDEGLTLKQIERVAGIGRGIICRTTHP